MYLVDYHTHSCCSPDSSARLEDMAVAARRAGLAERCTTGHCDLQQEDGTPLISWDWRPILRQFEDTARRCAWPDFRLLLGIELGGAHTDPHRARELLSGAQLDFVIGSVHNLSPQAGGQDFFFLDYPTPQYCGQVVEDYLASLEALVALPDCYDSLGHIIYPLRYMNGRAGHQITLEPWQDQVDHILRCVIKAGRAIEVNTHAGREIQEWRPILRRYRELGGELITLGSDAHNPPHVGKGLEQGAQLLQELGFRWLTLYRRRRPEQIKLI